LRYQSGPCSPSSWLPTKPLRSLRCTPRFGARADRQSRYLSIDFTLETVQSKGSIRSAGRFTPHLLHNRAVQIAVSHRSTGREGELEDILSRSGVLRSIGCFAAGAAGVGAPSGKNTAGLSKGRCFIVGPIPGEEYVRRRENRGEIASRDAPLRPEALVPRVRADRQVCEAPLHVTPHTLEKTFFFARRVTLGSSVIRFPVLIVRCGPVPDRRLRWRVRSGIGGHGRS